MKVSMLYNVPNEDTDVGVPAVVQHFKSEGVDQGRIDEYITKINADRNMPLSRRRVLASSYSNSEVFFSWDIPRTREGFYHYRAGLLAATKRAIEFAPYADLLWLETADPNLGSAAGFAADIRKAYPGKQLVYNLSPSFNWMGQGFTEASLKSFIWDLAKHGFDPCPFFSFPSDLCSATPLSPLSLMSRLIALLLDSSSNSSPSPASIRTPLSPPSSPKHSRKTVC